MMSPSDRYRLKLDNIPGRAGLKSCLTVNSTVSTEELFDFEPRLIHLPNPPARPGILSSLRR